MALTSVGLRRAVRAAIARPAVEVCQRIAAAAIGGYVLAVVLSIVIADWLPMPQFDAVMAGVLASFVLYLGLILWVFSVRSLRRLWLGLLIPTVVLIMAIWLLRWSAM